MSDGDLEPDQSGSQADVRLDSVASYRRRRVPMLITVAGVLIITLCCGIWLVNHLVVQRPLDAVLAKDQRNKPIHASAHWGGWINPNTLVFNVSDIEGGASRLDVFRVLNQYAEAVKGRHYSRVVLAAKGRAKFVIDGAYFQELGVGYSTQNPLYTIRTFPSRVATMDGAHPFHESDGGLLFVLQEEMQNFTEFSDEWYVNDFRNVITEPSAADSKDDLDPCEGMRERDPHCGWKTHWDDSGVSVNAIDGTRTEFLTMDSQDPDETDFGQLHYAKLVLCFENGSLCRDKSIGVGVRVDGMLASVDYETEYETPVRIRFDELKPDGGTWGVSDDREMLFPAGSQKQFAEHLTQHQKLVVEFSYFEKAPRTVTFDLAGLNDLMQSKGLSF